MSLIKKDRHNGSGEPTPFNVVRYMRRLREVGMEDQLAEVLVEGLVEWMSNNFVTKTYLDARLAELETRSTVRLYAVNGTTAVVIIGVVGWLVSQ